MEKHLGRSKNQTLSSSNSRNGYSSTTIKGDHGEVDITVPRDREIFPVSIDEIAEFASKNDASVYLIEKAGDTLNRNDVFWETVVLKLKCNS